MDFFAHYNNPPVHTVPHLGYDLRTPFNQQAFASAQSMGTFLHDPNWPTGPFIRPSVKAPGSIGKTSETKPRLAKEEVEQLESVFQKNNKPSANVKKEIAQQMGVEIARINNWFQNRRAKAKQERNAQEFEARQKRENASSPVQDRSPISEKNEPFMAAPTTNMPNDYSVSYQSAADADSPQSIGTESAEITLPHGHQVSELPTTAEPAMQAANQHLTFDFNLSAPEEDYFSHPCPLPNDMPASIPSHPQQPFPMSMNDFSMEMMAQGLDGISHFSPSHTNTGNPLDKIEPDVPQPSIELNYQPHAAPDVAVQSSPMSSPPLKSPPVVDLASRRKRPQPAALRTASYHVGPRTGIEFAARRSDSSSPMRRVASACGAAPGRIQKVFSMNAPRSPFVDRRHEQLLGALCSTGMQAPATTIGPPTPNTPIVSSTQVLREATVSSSASSDDDRRFVLSQSLGVPSLADPTLRTPPATPGMLNFPECMASTVSMEAALNFGLSDEPSLTPGLTHFPSDVAFRVPEYLADGSLSQPSTPAFPLMGPSYYGTYFSGGNPEYNWSDAGVVGYKTPMKAVQRTKQLQFTNFTQEDFSGEK